MTRSRPALKRKFMKTAHLEVSGDKTDIPRDDDDQDLPTPWLKGRRFLCLPVDALLDARLTDEQRRCLMALALHADRSGVCWPGRKTLAGIARMHETNISKAITALSRLGWITVERAPGLSNRYRLQVPEPEAAKATGS